MFDIALHNEKLAGLAYFSYKQRQDLHTLTSMQLCLFLSDVFKDSLNKSPKNVIKKGEV